MDFRKWWMNVPAILQLLFMTTYLVTENTLGKPTQGCFQAVPGKLDLLTHCPAHKGLNIRGFRVLQTIESTQDTS
ncbi:hypothetical protein ACRRTK_022709 [Alexandromys fortis]